MRGAAIVFLTVGLALGGCGVGGEAELDIVDFAPEQPTMFAIPGAGPDSVVLHFTVMSGELRSVLDRHGSADFLIFDCDAPDGPAETYPVFLGGEPITGIFGRQLSDVPDTHVLLSAAVPRQAAGREGSCARLVRHEGLFGPEIVSRPVPLPRS